MVVTLPVVRAVRDVPPSARGVVGVVLGVAAGVGAEVGDGVGDGVTSGGGWA